MELASQAAIDHARAELAKEGITLEQLQQEMIEFQVEFFNQDMPLFIRLAQLTGQPYLAQLLQQAVQTRSVAPVLAITAQDAKQKDLQKKTSAEVGQSVLAATLHALHDSAFGQNYQVLGSWLEDTSGGDDIHAELYGVLRLVCRLIVALLESDGVNPLEQSQDIYFQSSWILLQVESKSHIIDPGLRRWLQQTHDTNNAMYKQAFIDYATTPYIKPVS